MLSIRLVEFSGSGFWSVLSCRKMHRTPGCAFVERLLNGVHSVV